MLRKTLFLAFCAIFLLDVSAHGAADSWTGASSVNFNGSNWTGGNNPPATGDSLIFGTSAASGVTLTDNYFTTGSNVAGITFSAGAPAFVINPGTVGTNGFTLTGNLTDSATSVETINDLMVTAAVRTYTGVAGSDLVLGGNISGAGGFTNASSGTLTLSGNNSFTGNTIINSTSGFLALGSNTALGSGTLIGEGNGVVEAVGGPITISNVVLQNNSPIVFGGSQNLTITGSFVNGGTALISITNTALTTFSGGIDARNSAGNRTVEFVGTGNVLVNSAIINGIAGAVGTLQWANTGTLDLSGVNTYTGASIFQAGTVVLDASTNGSATLATPSITVAGGVAIGSVAPAAANAGAVYTGNTTLLVKGNYTDGSNTATTTVTITGNAGTTTNSNGTLSTVDGTPNTFTINSSAAAHTVVLTLGNNSNLNMEVGNTSDTIQLGATSGTYNAGVTSTVNVSITGLGNLNGTTQNLLVTGNTTPFTVGAGNNFNLVSTSGNFDGYTVGLSGATTGDLQLTETGLVATPATAFWSGTVSGTWNSFVNGNANNTNWLTAASAGSDTHQTPGATTNVLFSETSGAQNTTTTLGTSGTINSLEFTSAATGGGDVTIQGNNTLQINASGTNFEGVSGTGLTVDSGADTQTISSGIVLGGNQTWLINNSQSNPLTVSGTISGAHALTLAGPGELLLSGSNSYTGNTTVTNGALTVTGTLYGVGSGATLSVSGTGTGSSVLAGTGLINSAVSVGGGTGKQIIAGGSLAANGTITLAGGLTINSGGIVYFNNVATNTSANFISITSGGLAFNSGAIIAVPNVSTGTYQLINDAAANISGTANITLDGTGGSVVPSNYTLLISGGTLELSVTQSVTAQPTLTLNNLRVFMGQSGTLSGIVGNASGGSPLTGTLADNSPGGQLNGSGTLNISSFPTNPVTAAASASTPYTAIINNVGTSTGTSVVNVIVTDGFNSNPTTATTSATVSVLQNRTVSASTAAFGAVHVNATGNASTSLTSPGADNANTRVTVADGGVDSGTNGITVTGGNPSTVFNGSTSDSRNVTGTFGSTTLGSQSGTVTLTTTGEAGITGQTPINVAVPYTANIFSGQASWASSTGGLWTNNALWGDTNALDLNGPGAPGLAGAASIGDTATFNNISGQSGISTVSLSGTTATLAAITFNSASGYTISSGSITLQGAPTPITVSTGSDTITSVLQGSGAGLNVLGGGTLSLGGASTYSGSTQISNGAVYTTVTNALPTTTFLTLGDGSGHSGVLVLGASQTLGSGLATATGAGSSNAVLGGAGTVSTLTLTTGAAGNVYTFSGSVGGGGANQNNIALVVSGSGTQILSGSITYTGTTNIEGGVLQTSNLLPNSAITINGGVWQPVLTGSTNYNFTLGTTAAGNVGAWQTLNGTPNGSPSGGFAAFGGVLNLTANGGAQLSWGSGNFAGIGGDTITFGSATSNNQVILTNSINLNATDTFQQMVIVNGTTAGSSALLSGQLTQPAYNAGQLTQADGLKKNGLGTLILSNTTNNFSGAIFVEQGSLVAAGNANVQGSTGVFGSGTGSPNGTTTTPAAAFNITLGDGNTIAASNPSLYIQGAFLVANNITAINEVTNNVYSIGGLLNATGTYSGTISVQTLSANNNTFDVTQVATTGGNALNITGGIVGTGAAGESVNFANAGTVDVTGTIAGAAFSVFQSGTGTTILSGSNSYTGSTTITAGDLVAANTSGSAIGSGAVNLTPSSNAIATLSGNGTIGGAVTTTTGTGLNIAHIAPGVNTSGNFGGIGTLTLKGGLTIGNGTDLDFDLGSSSDLIAVTGQLTLGTGVVLNVSQAAGFAPGTYNLITYTGALTGNTTGWTLAGGPPATIDTFSSGGGVVSVTIALTPAPQNAYWGGAYGSGGNGTWNTYANGLNANTNWLSAISGGTDPLQVPSGTTNVFFIADTGSNTNTVLGTNFSINSLNFTGTDATVTSGSTVTISGSIIGSGTNSTLTINASGINGNASGSGITTGAGAAADTISAPVALGGNQTWTLNAAPSAPLTVSGTISGAQALTVTGTGELILGGNNTFTNGLTISGSAIVELTNAGALNSTSPDTLSFGAGSAGVLDLNGNSVTVAGLSTNATPGAPVIQNANVSTSGTLTVSQTGSTTYAGVLQNGAGSAPLALTLSSGTLTLAGVNTYTGSTTVNGGVLNIYGSLGSGSIVTVNSGGTLSGTGGSVGGAVTIKSGGTITAGTAAAPGTITLGNSLVINSGGIALFNIINGGANDEISISGGLTLASGAILRVTGGLNIPGVYTLFSYTGANPSLAGITETNLNGNALPNNYVFSSSGGQITLTITPPNDAVPSITITTPATGARVVENVSNIAITGSVGNSGPLVLDGTLSDGGGQLATSNFNPAVAMTATNGMTFYSADITNTGANLGSNTFSVEVTDGSASPTSATVTGTVDVVANRVVIATTGTFGSIHAGVSGTASTTLSSAAPDNLATRVTVGDGGVDNGGNGLTVTGGAPSGTFNGTFSDTRSLTGSFSNIGAVTGTVTLTTTGEGLVGESPINVNVGYTANVYSGKASWAIGTAGSWAVASNWGDTVSPDIGGPGIPGLAGAASINDTATFNDVAGEAATTTVSLNGVSPALAGITFTSVNTSYTIATGGTAGGTITLEGAATPISVTTGTDTISAVLTGSGSGLNKTGAGTLILGGADTYTGSTTISNGIIEVSVANALPATTVLTLGAGSNNGQLILGTTGAANQTLAGLLTAGSGTGSSVIEGANGTSTITLNLASGTDTFNGSLGGASTNANSLIFILNGGTSTATLLVTGTDTYTGNTSINGGVLSVPNSLSSSSIISISGNSGTSSVLQGDGTLTRAVGAANNNAAAGGLNLGSFGGFSAYGGTFTVSLTGALVWTTNIANAGVTGLDFGSTTSNAQVNFTSNLQLGGAGTGAGTVRTIYVERGTGGDSTLFSGVLSDAAAGTSGINKTGPGELIFSGANTYTGVTTIGQGVFVVDNSAASSTGSGNVSVTPIAPTGTSTASVAGSGSTATLAGSGTIAGSVTTTGTMLTAGVGQPVVTLVPHIAPGLPTNTPGNVNNFGNAGTLSIGGALTIGNGTQLDYDLGTSSDLITVSGTLNLGNNVVLNINQLTPLSLGTTYTLISYAGALYSGATVGSSALSTWTTNGNVPVGTTFTAFGNTGTSITIDFITTATTAYWTGNQGSGGNATWTTLSGSTTSNWATDATGATDIYQVPSQNTNVFFSENGGGLNTNTILGSNITINSLTFTTDSSGTAAVTIGGANTLTINAAAIGANPAGNGITVNSGADAETINANVALGGNQTWTINSNPSTPLTVNGSISGAHALTISGTGELVLGGNNTFTGGLTINGGIIQLTNPGALNSAVPASVTFGAGSTGDLQLNGNSVTVSALTTNATPGTPIVEDASGGGAPALLTVAQTGTTTYAGILQDGVGGGSLSLAVSGPGTWTLTSANTYSGSTLVSNGHLLVNGSLASTAPVTVSEANNNMTAVLGGTGTISGAVTINSPTGTNRLNEITGGDIGTIGTLTLAGGLTINAGGIAYFDIASTTSGDFINITSGGLNVGGGDAILRLPQTLTPGTYDLIGYTGAAPVLTNFQLEDFNGNPITIPNYQLAAQGGILELVVTGSTAAVPTIFISVPASGSRVMQLTTLNISGTVGNSTGGTTLNATLGDGGGSLTVSNFAPSNPLSVNSGTSSSFTANASTGSNLGSQTLIINATDPAATPTTASASATVTVVANRVVAATAVSFGSFHLGSALSSGNTTLTSLTPDNQATRVTVGDSSGTDANGILVTGGNTALVFNGSTSDTRTVSGTFTSVGSISGTIVLTTTGEGLAGESPVNVNVDYSAQIYSGKASWSNPTGGSWVIGTNWGDTVSPDIGGAGAPGVSGGLSIGDTATFNDVSGESAATTVNLDGANPTLAGITFNAVNTSYTIATGSGGIITLQGTNDIVSVTTGTDTISASISDASGLTKTGTGTLILSGTNNNFANTGTVSVNAGALQLANDNTLSTARIALVSGTGTPVPVLQLRSDTNGDTFATQNVTITGTGSSTIDVDRLTGAGVLSGTLNLSGTTTIGAQNLNITSADAYTLGLTNVVLTGSSTISPGTGSVLISGSVTGAQNLTLAGSGTGTITGAGITAATGVTESGSGLWILSGSSTYTGSTKLTSGTLGIALDSSPTSGVVGYGPVGTGTLALGGGTIVALGSGHTIANALTTTGANAGAIAGSNSLTLNGLLTLGASSSLADNNTALTTFGGGINLNADALTVTGSGNVTVNSPITGGAGSLIWNNGGVLTITGTGSTYTGATTISSGTVQLGDGTTDGALAATPIANNSALVFNTNGGLSYSGNLSGTGSLTMNGLGIQVLSGNNSSFTGSVIVNTGTLSVGSTHALGGFSQLNVGSAGTMNFSTGVGTNTFTLTSASGTALTLGNGANLDFGVGNGTVDELVLQPGANVSVNGTININLSLLSIGGVTSPTPIIYAPGATGMGLNAATFVLSGTPGLATASITQTSTEVEITLSSTVPVVYWSGNGSTSQGFWSDYTNFTSDAAGTTPLTGTFGAIQDVVFSGSGAINQNNSLLDYNAIAHSLSINDPAGVVITGFGGTLTLAGISGTTGINTGTAASVTQAQIDANVDLAGTPNVTVDNTGGLLINGAISGTSGLIVNGADTLSLTGVNTYTGGTQLISGTLNVNSDSVFGASGAGNGVTFNPGAGSSVTLQAGANGVLTASNRTFMFASGTGVIDPGLAGNVFTIAGPVTGSSALQVIDTGELVLSGSVAYTGTAFVSSGTLALTYPGTLGQTGSSVFNTVPGGTLLLNNTTGQNLAPTAGSVTFSGNGTLLVAGSGFLKMHNAGGGNINFNMTGGTIEVSGGLLENGGNGGNGAIGNPTQGGGSATWTNNLAALQLDSGASFDPWDGNNPQFSALLGSGTLTRLGFSNGQNSIITLGVNNGSGTFSGVITNQYGTNSIVKTGTGIQVFGGNNSYSGSTGITGGTLRITSSTGLGFGGPEYIGAAAATATVSGASTLDMNGNITVDKAITLNGGDLTNSGAGTTALLDNGIAAIALAGAQVGTYTSPMITPSGGNGSGATFGAGSGTSPGGTNVYGYITTPGTGYTVAPTLTFADSNSGTGAGVTASATLSSLTLSGIGDLIGGPGNLTINAQISGTGGFTTTGTGTLTLTGSNSYTGTTTVAQGVTDITGVEGGSGPVNVAPTAGSATLEGTGSIAGLVTTIAASGSNIAHLAPGVNTSGNFGAVGTLTLKSGLTIGNGTNLDFDISNSSSDLIAVTGALSLGSGVVLNINAITNGFSAGTYTLITYTGALSGNTSTWTATGASGNTATFASGGGVVTVTLGAFGANNSQLTITPSPISLGSVLVGFTPASTTGTLANASNNGSNANYTTVATGSASVSPANGTLGANSSTTLTVGASSPINLTSGNNQVIGTVYATNSSNSSGSAAPVNVTANVFQAFTGTTPSSTSGVNSAALTLTNLASTDGGQRAGVSLTGFSVGNPNFAVTGTGSVGIANASNVTATVGTITTAASDLNGSYSYTGSVTSTAQYTDPALAAQAGVSNQTWSNVTLTATVTGQTSNARTNVFSAQIQSGSSYAGYSLSSSVMVGGVQQHPNTGSGGTTTATLLAGTASATTTVDMSFDSSPVSGPDDGVFRTSDILTLTGIHSTGTATIDTLTVTLTDQYVLQLSYDMGAAGLELIGQNTGTMWVNAADLNSSTATEQLYANESYATYVAGTAGGDTPALGAYGYDAGVAWAVLNHTSVSDPISEFAVIPEPGTYAMIFSGFGMLIGFRRLRRRAQDGKDPTKLD